MTRLVAAILSATVGLAAAADVPIAGKSVRVGAATAAKRTFAFVSQTQPAIATPFPDPTAGATLRVFVSRAPGQCQADIALPGGFWSPISGDGPQKGWRYRDQTASAQGIRAVTIASRKGAGKITIKGRGAFPCGLESPQSGPLAVELRVAADRWCASFGGNVRKNTVGHYRALAAPAPAACLGQDVTIASLNVLHGIFCPPASVGCRRADRMALVRDFVVARGCPDVLAFQEVFDISSTNENAETLAALLTNACPAPYVHAYHNANAFDDEIIFSRYPLLTDEVFLLYGNFRNVLHVRVDHPIGPVDVYATHLASGSDLATNPCGATLPCPPECIAAGAATVRDCQAVQMAQYIEATHDVPTLALAVGDFNQDPGTYVYQQFASRGWTDTYLAAGNPECVPATGVGCTSGRQDEELTDIENPALNQTERIDYVWLIPAGAAALCAGTTEPAGDPDGDGVATRLFADEPNPFAACSPSPLAVCWSSDHTGVQADINCP